MTTSKNGQRIQTADTDVRGIAQGKRRKLPKHGSLSTADYGGQSRTIARKTGSFPANKFM